MPAPFTHSLLCHPTGQCAALRAIAVDARLTEHGALALRYRLTGQPAGLCLPAPQPPGPADGLWQHSCCEAFIAEADGTAYREFNFSPSGQWAAYRFTAYRQRDSAFVAAGAPHLVCRRDDDGCELAALLTPPLLPPGQTLHLGLSAVIEAADGGKSYWALAHAGARPDFHLRQSFSLILHRNAP